jgi:hypothetical protein
MIKVTLTAIEKLQVTLTFDNGTSILFPISEIPTDTKVGDELFVEIVNKKNIENKQELDAKKILNELLSK